ncbi:MAG: amino acid ABC transporter substrate-binding protein [Alphaproteobacteria bacterium]|nr:MAG: amino acid ABC transporter substrate-binding protein [Alphaproteobacteria bacterium]
MAQSAKTVLISIVASLAVCFLLINWMGLKPQQASNAKESVYERVIRAGTIRCGYFNVPPYMIKNPNTGELSGIAHDVMEQVGARLNMKIEWVMESAFPTMAQDLNQDRYDALCSGAWNMPTRAKVADFTVPFFFTPSIVIVRADDTRFDKDVTILNNSDYTLAIVEGTPQQYLHKTRFQNAKLYSLPEYSSPAEALEVVATKKADAAIYFVSELDLYNRHNPDKKLKNATPNHPVFIGASSMIVKKGEVDFKNLLDQVLLYLMADGTVDEILKKYQSVPGSFLRVANPYQPLSVQP